MKTLLLCLLLAAISQPTVPLDELQELLAANLDAMEKLHKVLLDHSDTNQPEMTEVIAAATSNAVRELLEQRQRNFEQEEKEAIAQGKLTPQECYSRLAADYTAMLEQYRMVCKAYEYIVGLVIKRQGIRLTGTLSYTEPLLYLIKNQR